MLEVFTTVNKVKDMKLGPFYIEGALKLRESIILSCLLFGAELMANITEQNFQVINSVDSLYWNIVLDTPRSTPRINTYAELGILTPKTLLLK